MQPDVNMKTVASATAIAINLVLEFIGPSLLLFEEAYDEPLVYTSRRRQPSTLPGWVETIRLRL